MSYVDLVDIHNPATSAFVPASWGHQVRDNDWWQAHRPHAHAYMASPQDIATITTTELEFNTERRDNAGIHSTVSDKGVFYLATAGTWLLWCGGVWEVDTTGVRILTLTVNDYSYPFRSYHGDADGTVACPVNRAVSLRVNAGAEIRWTAYQNSGGNLTLDAEAGVVLLSL